MKHRIGLLLTLSSLGLVPAALAALSDNEEAATNSVAAAIVHKANTPELMVNGSDVTVSWDASGLSGGENADGYQVFRYDAMNVGDPVGGCGGVVSPVDLSCIETNVPAGTWVYRIVPRYKSWTGPASDPSEEVMIDIAPFAPPAAPLSLSAATENPEQLDSNSDVQSTPSPLSSPSGLSGLVGWL